MAVPCLLLSYLFSSLYQLISCAIIPSFWRNVLRYFLSIILLNIISTLALSNPAGYWITLDDTGQKPRAIVEVKVNAKRELSAYIRKVYPLPTDTGFCRKCPGEFKNKPIKDLRIVWDVKHVAHHTWDKGRILDPKKGKLYDCKLTELTNDPTHLQVRGYIKLPFLGKTKLWRRATAEEIQTI